MTCVLLVSVATNDYDASLGDKTGNKTLHIHFTVSVCVEQQTDQDHKDAAILDTHIFSSCFPFLYMYGAAVEPTVCNRKVPGSSPSLCTFVWVRLEA